MVRIIAFEGSDYSGKTTVLNDLARELGKNPNFCFNEGAIYPNGLSARLSAISNQCNPIEQEFLYTMGYVLDGIESTTNYPQDNRIFFQDRYWPSVVAYGKFLNKEKSIHNQKDFLPLFIIPTSTILLSCSYEEKIKRSKIRGRKSIIDKFLLDDSSQLKRLEEEIEKSLEGLPNIYRTDTTNKPVKEISSQIKNYLSKKELI